MATSAEQTDLVVQQVRNLVDVAADAYSQARNMLEDLATTSTNLPFSLVNPDIGATATISWQSRDTVTFPTLPAVPSTVGDPPAPLTLANLEEISIAIPDQPTLDAGTVSLPGDITVGTVEFPVEPTFPIFDESYLNIAVTPPTHAIVLPGVGEVQITIPTQPTLGAGTVEIPGDITVATVDFPTSPVYPVFDPSYLNISTTPPVNDVVLSEFGDVFITIPDQPVLAPATVELPGDITVATVDFPVAPIFPVFDESYLDFTINEPSLTGALTDVDFEYLEPTYTQTILSEVTAVISRVLGGDLGLPNDYWTALWEQSANDLTRQQNGRLRNARNKGAASFWSLPSETALAASAEIQDEVARAAQLNRIEQAKSAVEKAREDLWKAVELGISSEQLLIGMFEQMAGRALASAQTLFNMKVEKNKQLIELYNADINKYSATAQGKATIAQAYASSYNSQVDGLASVFKAEIDGAQGEIELEKAKIDAWIAKWNGYKTEADVRINTLNAQTQLWTSAVDNTVKVEVARQEKDDREIELYKADISAYDAETRGKSTIAQAYTSSYAAQTSALAQQFKSEVEAALGRIDLEKAKVEAWIAEWQGYKVDSDVRIGELNAQTQLWSSAVENTVKIEGLKQNVGSQEIELYKADVSAYSAQVDGGAKLATAYSSSYGNQVSALTQKYKSQIDAALGEIELEKSKIEAWIAKWKGYETEANTRISKLQAETQLWTSAVSNTVNVEQVRAEFDKNKISYYTAQMGQIEAMARVVAALAQAHTANANAQVNYANVGVDLDKAKNQIETQLTGLTQAAQEAVARLEIEQAQWLQGQGVSIQQRMAELSFGYAQAAIAASDVSLSSGVGINFSDSSDRNYSWDMVEQGTYIPPGV